MTGGRWVEVDRRRILVLDRDDLALRPPVRPPAPIGETPDGCFVHWAALAVKPSTTGGVAAACQALQRYHMTTRGWVDIAYTALAVALPDGTPVVAWGRGPGVAGAHTRGHNTASHGVCWLGGPLTRLTPADLDAVWAAVRLIEQAGFDIRPLRPHRAVRQTACPGDQLASWAERGGGWATATPVSHPPPVGRGRDVRTVATGLVDRRRHWRPPATRTLRRGMRGKDVAELQCLLLWAGAPIPRRFTVDGIFGPLTEQAVRGFQQLARVEGLSDGPVDGAAGPKTGHAVVWRLNRRGIWR